MPDQETQDGATIYRLSDIDTEEVSIVDAAANRRKFLVVKGANTMSKAGAPVVSDGKGGHTVAKETPAQPSTGQPGAETPPAAAPQAAPETAPQGGPTTEPKLTLAPEAKAELLKRFAAATERLAALKALIDSAEEVPGLVEVPEEIASKVAELLTGIAQGEVQKNEGEQGATNVLESVAKGLPQFSTARVSQLQAAYDALGTVLGSIAPAPTEPETPPSTEAPPAEAGDVAKAVAAALLPMEEKIAKGLEKIAAIVAQHDAAIQKQAGRVEAVEKAGRPTPRSGAPEGARETVGKDDGGEYDDGGAWPSDMADPDKHDVNKVDPSVRFTSRR